MLSIIIPASNEADWIGPCLEAVLASEGPVVGEIVVVANGCHDGTAAVAQGFAVRVEARGWRLVVLDLVEGGKLIALAAGDAAATGTRRVYLDADVVVSPGLMGQLDAVLQGEAAVYASGRLVISEARSWASRAYRRIYQQVPFMAEGVPGAGVFAVNAAGRARWDQWPAIMSDDTFVRLSFAPKERRLVEARYSWPIVEGFRNLVRVRRRQNAGVAEIRQRFPELLKNDDTRRLGRGEMMRMAVGDPLGFVVYVGVSLAVKVTGFMGKTEWRRGR